MSDLFETTEYPLQYFLSYKCSQDHLELFFSCIRGCGGHNNNPTALNLRYTLRKLLFRNSVEASTNANCNILEESTLQVSIFDFNTTNISFDDCINEDEIDADLLSIVDRIHKIEFSRYQDNILYYISGVIARKYFNKYSCKYCRDIILCDTPDHNYIKNEIPYYAKFTRFISRGGLLQPKELILSVIKCTEKLYQFYLRESPRDLSKNRVIVSVCRHFFSDGEVKFPHHPIVDTDITQDGHELRIVKFFSSVYFNLRIHTDNKKKALAFQGSNPSIRQKLTKLILFKNA